MSSPTTKSVKKLASRSASRQTSTSSAHRRVVGGKSSRLKPATKRSPAGKARAQKASKTRAAKPKVKARATSSKSRPVKSSQTKKAVKVSRRVSKPPKKLSSALSSRVLLRGLPPREVATTPPPQPTQNEAAALRAFEAAHREFTRGHFSEARLKFRALLDKYSTVSEVAARSRTYLAVAEARLRSDLALPRDADSLYDRGVIELNRGEYVAAQELFERALKREPEAAHIHYGLAATRSRLGAIDTALKSLRRAFDLQPNLRIRAQRDQDLNPLRSDPEFDVLVFAARE
jgi:tetratricopeptide (TPR) repeat protein